PLVASQTPLAGASVINTLTQITVNFSKAVTNVDASDFLIDSVPATGLSGGLSSYTFTFPQPAYGTVSIGWASNHGIKDLAQPPNDFDPLRSGNSWTYTLIDQIPPTIVSKVPAAGAQVTNLTQITVTFSEPVSG